MTNAIHLGWFEPATAAFGDARRQFARMIDDARPLGLVGTNVLTHDGFDMPIDDDARFGEFRGFALTFTFQVEVAHDAWSALVVLNMARAFAAEFSAGRGVVFDDGNFVLPGGVILEGRTIAADLRRTDILAWDRRVHADLRVRESGVPITPVVDAPAGVFFPIVDAEPYGHVPALRRLKFSTAQLAKMTLDDVAAHVRFPWNRGHDSSSVSK